MKSGFLKGYRTYILAALAVLGALAGYAIGDLSLYDMLEKVWAGGVAASLRSGVNAATEKATNA